MELFPGELCSRNMVISPASVSVYKDFGNTEINMQGKVSR
jgi:hypothetical protein